MQFRPLGQTGIDVSVIGFGNFVFGTNWWGDYSDEEGIRLQNQAYDRGITFFDTGDAYGNGRAERLMAETIRYAGRDNLVISTKFGYDFYSDAGTEGSHKERKQDFSPKFIRHALEQSLQRMKIDHIDLYQAHNLKLPQYHDDLFSVLSQLKDEGKVKEWGVALGPAIGWREEGIAAICERGAATVQTVFNLFEQAPGREFCELAEQSGSSVLARVPMNSGILEDIFDENTTFGPNDHRKYRDRDWLIYGLKKG